MGVNQPIQGLAFSFFNGFDILKWWSKEQLMTMYVLPSSEENAEMLRHVLSGNIPKGAWLEYYKQVNKDI